MPALTWAQSNTLTFAGLPATGLPMTRSDSSVCRLFVNGVERLDNPVMIDGDDEVYYIGQAQGTVGATRSCQLSYQNWSATFNVVAN